MNSNKPIRAYTEFSTNIKGLPEGEYVTETGYSETYAWQVVSKTAKTMTIRPVRVSSDPEWKPEIIAGGFAGHCTNQSEQTWMFDGFEDFTAVVRLKKSRYYGSDKLWGSAQGSEFIANGARRKHDYNF